MPNRYRGKAIRTKVIGHAAIGLSEDVHEYDSKLEARCAQVFLRHGIQFKPHVRFQCIDRNGNPFTYEVDFLFKRPIKLPGISPAVDAIEVKGVLRQSDTDRIDALKYKHNIRTWVATETLIQMWEHDSIPPEKENY